MIYDGVIYELVTICVIVIIFGQLYSNECLVAHLKSSSSAMQRHFNSWRGAEKDENKSLL